jgi:hypothetical protein
MTALSAAGDDGIDWLSPEPAKPAANGRPDALARALALPDPAERAARLAANIAAAPPLPKGERGTLKPGQAWLVADWCADAKGTPCLGRVRIVRGEQAQGEAADLKRPLIQIDETPKEAWRHLCRAFGWADPPAVYAEVSKVQGLEWVARQHAGKESR